MRRLLDGRFADVNRRVGDVRAAVELQDAAARKLTRELEAQGTTQNEALSYTATSLRRLEEALAASQGEIRRELEHLRDRAYVERLDRVGHGALGELDGALAAAINVAGGHHGFAAQAGLWFNPAVTVELGEGSARLADVNERIVELPFALGQLARLQPPARILDIGGAESTFALSAAALGYQVTVVDPQGPPFEHPNLTRVPERLEAWTPAAEEPFAGAFLVSAIEHFGLGAYGEQAAGAQADREALMRVRELLADDGLLVLTTPYGKASVNDLERIYDDAGLDALLVGWQVIERRTIVRTDRRTWLPGSEGSAGAALIAAIPMPAS
jgi:hypothetical protein